MEQQEVKRTKSNCSGFTMLELIVVMTILVAITTGALFSGTYLVQSMDLNSATHTTETYLETAKAYTLDHYNGQTNYGVAFSGNNVYLYQGTTYPSLATVIKTFSIPVDITVSNDTLPGGYVYFQSLTDIPNNSGTLSMKSFTATYSLTITNLGIINLQKQ